MKTRRFPGKSIAFWSKLGRVLGVWAVGRPLSAARTGASLLPQLAANHRRTTRAMTTVGDPAMLEMLSRLRLSSGGGAESGASGATMKVHVRAYECKAGTQVFVLGPDPDPAIYQSLICGKRR